MQINRLFEIIYILLNKKTITAKELSSHFQVSTRTIYRDIEILSSVGMPLYMTQGKGGGISILDNFIFNKTLLTEKEKTDILSAIRTLDAVSFNDTNSTSKKLSSFFGQNNNDWIEIDFSSWDKSQKESELFLKLKSAIISKKIITFAYSSAKGENTIREVEPLRLIFKGMSRYLYAFCTIRNDYRFFKLSRIKDFVLTEKSFNREVLSPIFKNDNTFNEEYVNLKLKLSPKMAFRVYDEFENIEKLSDGSFIVKINYPKGDWVYSYIFSFGNECEILEPANIRDEFKIKIQKILKKYL